MPYILVRGNLASYSHRYPWRVLVSGLKGIIPFPLPFFRLHIFFYVSCFFFKLIFLFTIIIMKIVRLCLNMKNYLTLVLSLQNSLSTFRLHGFVPL